MSKDSKDNEVSAEIGLTPTGIRAKFRSKAVAAIDWVLGTKIDIYGADLETEKQLKQAVNERALAVLEHDPELVQAAVQDFKVKLLRQYNNKIAVGKRALEEIGDDKEVENIESPSEVFRDNFEPYAEKASTEELRAKWGKVLAGEIRKPGTFSPKVMRIVDEVDKDTAELFQEICQDRISNIIPICLVGKLSFMQQKKLEDAGLITSSEKELVAEFNNGADNNGQKTWMLAAGNVALCFKQDIKINSAQENTVLIHLDNRKPKIPAYALTDAGRVIASIFENKQRQAFYSYIKKLTKLFPEEEIKELTRSDKSGNEWKFSRIWKNGKPLPGGAEA